MGWCEKLNIPYPESFHVHGDLYETWAKNYEFLVERSREFKRRTQATDPTIAAVSLKKFANFLGRGKKVKVKLKKKNRYLHHLLKAQDPDKAEQIRLGVESSSDESSSSDD